MTAGQSFRGFVGQGMNGRKAGAVFPPGGGPIYNLPPSSTAYRWSPPTPGFWKFAAWGVGGNIIGHGGASGSYGEITRSLSVGQTVSILVPSWVSQLSAIDTTIIFPDGKTVIAGSAIGITPGIAQGFDLNLNGTPGTAGGHAATGGAGQGTGGGQGAPSSSGSLDGGAGAPGNLPFRGGSGDCDPGGGGSENTITAGAGLVLITLVST